MKRNLLLTCLLSFFIFTGFAQQKITNLFSKNTPSALINNEVRNNVNSISSAQLLNVNESNNQVLYNQKQNYELSIPSKNGEVIVEIVPFEVLTADFKVMTPTGEFKMELPTFYKGKIKGENKSFVALTVTKETIEGLISSEKVNLTIGKLKNTKENFHVVYNTDDIVNNSPICALENPPVIPLNDSPNNTLPQTNAVTCRAVEIYLEADFKMYTDWGNSVPNVVNTMTGIFNNVSLLYDNEGVNLVISQLFVWTSIDPYASAASTSAGLTLLNNYWTSNGNNFNGDIVHLVSTRNLGGGIAYLSGGTSVFNGMTQRAVFQTCDKSAAKGFSAGVSNSVVNIPTYSWNVNLIAHELGHNFGLPHTHSCTWSNGVTTGVIDNCGPTAGYNTESNTCAAGPTPPLNGGTIMSYCHLINTVRVNFSNGFGPLPGGKMLAEFNAATCLTGSKISKPTVAISNICTSSTVTLVATGCTGTYNWYQNLTGGTSLGNLSSFTTPILSTSTSYYVSCTVGTCVSKRGEAKIVVFTNTPPIIDTVQSCGQGVSTKIIARGCSGLTYNWYSAATGGVAIGTGPILTANVSSDSTFYADCSLVGCGVSPRTAGFVNYDSTCAYCLPLGNDCNSDDVITRFRILKNAIILLDSASMCTANGYSFIQPINLVNLTKDSTYSFKLNKPVTYSEGFKIYIDYNKDGIFSNTEVVYTSTSNLLPEVTGNFIIPLTAKIGATRMRVKLIYNGIPIDPCSTTEGEGFGETEDYLVNIKCTESVSYPATLAQVAGNYRTSQNIISRANVATGTNYYAGKFIMLDAGFQAGGNETFQAKITGCQ
jgi:Metallo-peptidase family M12/GEVED domain/Ig-like domain CHU_C associated